MIEILKNYCNSENGLLLFNPPTGSGKTYNVLKWIFENYEEYCVDSKKIFFITNLKKNLPYEDLKVNHFEVNGKLREFDKSVLFIDSNSEYVINNFEDAMVDVDVYFTKLSVYKKLKRHVEQIKWLDDKPSMKEFQTMLKDDLRTKYEREFREKIESYLKENYPNKRARLTAINNEKGLRWIGKLYPSVYSSRKKIFFLSMDKFYAQNSTIVEPSYHFINHEITKNAIIFIDEIDATKDRLLDKIIKKGKSQKVDYIHLFEVIHWALSNNSLPAAYLEHSIQRQEQINEGKTSLDLKGIEEKLRKKADEIENLYRISFSMKTLRDSSDTRQRNLLFHDFQYHAVYRNNKRYISINTDKDAKVNHLQFEDIKPANRNQNLVVLLNSIKGYIKYFEGAIKNLAMNYRETLNERRNAPGNADNEFSFDRSLSSILEEFRLEGKYKRFIMDNILSEREKLSSSSKKDLLHYDFSIYENGFRYFNFIDDEEHESITKTFIYNFNNTPEKFLLKLAERAKVIGISATAKIETVVGNYDIAYLKRQLGNSFFELNDLEAKSLKDRFDKQNDNYKKVNIHPEWFSNYDTDIEIRKGFIELLDDTELADHFIGRLGNQKDYIQNRYLRIAKVFKRFVEQDDINALLCLLNKEPKLKNWDLDIQKLSEIFDTLIKIASKQSKFSILDVNDVLQYNVENSFVILNSQDFETKKDELIGKLQSGQKVFIISMYQTIGAGQNLQYVAPDLAKLIDVTGEGETSYNSTETDINAIYLDKPTHLLQLITKDLKVDGFILFLFQLEFLLEAGRISMKQLKSQVTDAFQNLHASANSTYIPYLDKTFLYNDYNIRQHYSKYIIQAIGRICRTNLKSPNIYVFADDGIKKHIADFNVDDALVLNEFKALVKSCPQSVINPDKVDPFKNRAALTNKRTLSLINRYVERGWNWSEIEIKKWIELRNRALRFPTLTLNQAKENKGILDVYIDLPIPNNNYSYIQKGDFKEVEFDFENLMSNKVSSESARLNELFSIPGVLDYFKSKDFATSFEPGPFIICPVFFHNVYKGALGEEVGKYIFEQKLGISLEELSQENYELFDFKIANTDIFIDFKHWQEYSNFEAGEMKNKITRKLEKVEGSKAIIVNILASSNFKPISSIDGSIVEIANLFDSETKSFNVEALNLITEII